MVLPALAKNVLPGETNRLAFDLGFGLGRLGPVVVRGRLLVMRAAAVVVGIGIDRSMAADHREAEHRQHEQ